MSTTEQTETQAAAPAPSTLLGRMATAASPSPLARGGSTLLRNLIVTIVLGVIVIALTYVLPNFRDFQLATVLAYVCGTVGLTVLIGLNGQLSLGHGAIMAVGGYTFAFVQNYLVDHGNVVPGTFGTTAAPWTIYVSLAAGVVAATLAGALIGLAAARLRGPYLAGVTLAVAVVVQPITTTFKVFNGDQGVSIQVPKKPVALENEQWQAWLALFGAALVMLLFANLIHSRMGRNFRAVRDDEVAAQLSGIHVARTQVIAFVLSSAAAGVGGGILALIFTNAQPGAFSLTLSLYLVLGIVLGGLGSLAGAVWGALFLVLVPAFTTDMMSGIHTDPANLQKLTGNLPLAIFGLALIVVTIVAPGGIQNFVRRVGGWLRRLIRRPASN